jgi:hypothetical protein
MSLLLAKCLFYWQNVSFIGKIINRLKNVHPCDRRVIAVWLMKLKPFRRMKIELLETLCGYLELKKYQSRTRMYTKGQELDHMAI